MSFQFYFTLFLCYVVFQMFDLSMIGRQYSCVLLLGLIYLIGLLGHIFCGALAATPRFSFPTSTDLPNSWQKTTWDNGASRLPGGRCSYPPSAPSGLLEADEEGDGAADGKWRKTRSWIDCELEMVLRKRAGGGRKGLKARSQNKALLNKKPSSLGWFLLKTPSFACFLLLSYSKHPFFF